MNSHPESKLMKKFISSVAFAGVVLSGLGVSQASADTAFVNSSDIAGAYTSFTYYSVDTTSVEVPEGTSSVNTSQPFTLSEEFLVAHAGEVLSYGVSVLDPQGDPITFSEMASASHPTYSKSGSGWLNGPGSWVNVDWENYTLTIPQNASGYSGEYTPEIYLNASNLNENQTLPAGTYTVSITLYADGVAVGSEAGVTVSELINQATVQGTTSTAPAGTNYSGSFARMCADPEKIAEGDALKAEVYVDGVLSQNGSISWSTRTGFLSGQPGFRNSDFGASTTVTAYDVLNGLAASASIYGTNFASGTTHTLAYKLYNSTTSEDVSGDCAPAKPAAPNVNYAMSMVTASGTYAFGTSGSMQCLLFDKSAPTVEVSRTYGFNQGAGNYSCSLYGTKSGHTYFVKVVSTYWDKSSDLSNASADIVLPASGYTITSSYAGTVGAGKIVKVNDNSIPIEDLSSYTSSTPDGKGGLFTWGSSTSCTMMCQLTALRIRHMSNTTVDSTFGGTGEIFINSFIPTNAFVSGMGYYGTNKDKWIAAIGGYEDNMMDAKIQLILGNATNATTTSKIVTKSAFNSVCDSGASGYGLRPTYTPSISVIGTPTANPYLLLTCWKQITMADSTQQWNSIGVLASVDPATGTLTLKKALGTPSENANGFSARTSVNPDATGTQPLITALVTSFKYTSYTQMMSSFSGTVAEHTIIRIAADGSVTETTGAWGTNGGSSSTEPYVYAPTINSGTIFALMSAGPTTSLVKITSSGVAGTPLAVVTTGSSITNPRLGTLSGYAISGSETLIPVSVSGMSDFAAGWINASTGALTVGEKMSFTSSPGNGSAVIWLNGNDKNTYLFLNVAAAPNNLTVFKWIDSRYAAPTGPVPTVTSKNLKYSKNTPAAGTKVTLTGTNLNAVTSATIGGNAAALGTKSATSLQLTVPTASSAGTVDIVLTTADGATTVDTFTYVGTGVEQSVAVADLPDSVVFGAADLALSASVTFSPNDAGTQGAITWSSDTPTVCSIVSGKARFLTGGTCTVKATAAASGLLLAGSDTETLTVNAKAQTITLSGPTNPEVDLDGIDLTASTDSGLALTFATSTAEVCSVDSTGHVTPITAGECVVTASQAGNASWLSDSEQATIVFVAAATTPIVDNGNPASPNTLSKTGAWVKNGDTQLSWNRTKGTLAFKVSIVYVGPIKGTAVFKIGSKTHTCVVNFGTLKKQATSKRLVLTSPNLCSGAKEKVQLAALKKAPVNMVVKLTIVRDMKFPTTYAKYRTKTRVIYAKLG